MVSALLMLASLYTVSESTSVTPSSDVASEGAEWWKLSKGSASCKLYTSREKEVELVAV